MSFSGSNLFVFETTETKLKQFLGMLLSKTDSINMVEGPGGHPDPSRTSKLFIRGYKGGNNWPKSLILAQINFFWRLQRPHRSSLLPITDSINMVKGLEGNLDHSITARMCFSWYIFVKHSLSTRFFEGLNSDAF